MERLYGHSDSRENPEMSDCLLMKRTRNLNWACTLDSAL